MLSPETNIFVGRQHEVERLRRATDGAFRDNGRVVFLHGPPGSGKTRTCESLVRYARSLGGEALLVACDRGIGALPFDPWRAVVRHCAGLRDDGVQRVFGTETALRTDVRVRSAVADLGLESADGTADAAGAPPARALTGRGTLEDGLLRLIEDAAERSPLLLIFDDFDASDPSSAAVLRDVAPMLARVPVLLVITYGNAAEKWRAPLVGAMAELRRQCGADEVTLAGFSVAETAEYLACAGAGGVPTAAAERFHRLTGDTPFFLSEAVWMLREGNRLGEAMVEPHDPPEVPERVEDLILRQVTDLSAAARRCVQVVAVSGTEVRPEILDRIEGNSFAAVNEAVLARLLVRQPGEQRCYRCRHELIRRAVYGAMPAAERRHLHQRIAETLEQAPDRAQRAPDLALHRIAALPDGDARRAAEALREAARQALACFAPENAVRCYELAIEVVERALGPEARDRGDLLVELRVDCAAAGALAGTQAAFEGAAVSEWACATRQGEEAATPRFDRAAAAGGRLTAARGADNGTSSADRGDAVLFVASGETRQTPPPRIPEQADEGDGGPQRGGHHRTAVLSKRGDYWVVGADGCVLHLKAGKGLEYIALLLRHPGHEFHALELAARISGTWEAFAEQSGLRVSSAGEPIEVTTRAASHRHEATIDAVARSAYIRRLAELRDELAEAAGIADLGRTEKLREEAEFIADQLATAMGVGGRSRAAADNAERARAAIQKRIRGAIRGIQAGHPELGHYLQRTVKTGLYCAYVPDPSTPLRWTLS